MILAILEGALSMTYERAEKAMFDLSNIVRGGVFRVLNISRSREPNRAPGGCHRPGASRLPLGHARMAWQPPWPLTARVPIVSGALILIVAIALSHVMMSTVAHEQELGVRRLAAVYLDGISTTIHPHVVAWNLANTIEALRRTMWVGDVFIVARNGA